MNGANSEPAKERYGVPKGGVASQKGMQPPRSVEGSDQTAGAERAENARKFQRLTPYAASPLIL